MDHHCHNEVPLSVLMECSVSNSQNDKWSLYDHDDYIARPFVIT